MSFNKRRRDKTISRSKGAITMKTRKIKFICEVAKWFDRVNGNTYHSVKITRIKDSAVIKQTMTYGYERQYEQTALELMAKNKWLPVKYREDYFRYCMDNNYPIEWIVTEGLKRDMLALAS